MLRALNFKCLSKKSGLRQLVTRSRGCREGRPDMTATYSNEGLLFESFITHGGAIHIFRTRGFPPSLVAVRRADAVFEGISKPSMINRGERRRPSNCISIRDNRHALSRGIE